MNNIKVKLIGDIYKIIPRDSNLLLTNTVNIDKKPYKSNLTLNLGRKNVSNKLGIVKDSKSPKIHVCNIDNDFQIMQYLDFIYDNIDILIDEDILL